ncbi:MAG: translation initiation factor IF-2 [Nitrososphaerales archaeon]|nr:translation initiation factor IF-2 [Nitrososphaerales archaeon]
MDSGKCVSGGTLIQLADGRIYDARKVFETFKTGEPIEKPDGVVHPAKNLRVLSVGADGRAVGRTVSHVWKLHADKLVTVRTKAGYVAETTPEHKFLVMDASGGLSYVEAERLKLGDFLLVPSRSFVFQSGLEQIKASILARLSDDFLLRGTDQLNERIAALAKGNQTRLGAELNDPNLSYHIRKGYYRVAVFRELASRLGLPLGQAYDTTLGLKFASRKRRATHKSPWIALPKSEEAFEALAYLVGLLYGDGLAGKAHLSNTSDDIISEYKRCLLQAFGVGASQAWRRTSYIVSHKGGKSLARFLVEAFDYPVGDKTRSLHVPEVVSLMPDRFVAKFLRGFFDAEGFVQEGRNIGVGCESKMLMAQLPILLQRFGCLAYFGKKGHSREIMISGRNFVSAFVDHVGFRDGAKMDAARKRLSFSETNRVFELTPIPGEFLRSIRREHRVVWDDHFQLTSFEPYPRLSKSVLTRLPKAVPTYRNEDLERVLENFSMVQVTGLEISDCDSEVFDFTVEETHNFLANGLIIHNTSLLDKIRGTAVQAREAGGITQEIGASYFPLETLQAISGTLLEKAGGELQVPGLLVIDTPGHEVFSNLRMRGGSAADIAILVVDILKGLENQTLESIDILKQRRVPFLVALNKIDMIKGWRKESRGPLLQIMKEQTPEWNDEFEERLYNVVGGLSRLSFQSDAYYRVKDFKQQVSIVPVSARYAAGIPELLAMLIGLAQQFLKGKLQLIGEGHGGRGIILEMQEEVGIGETANVILTEGRLKVGDGIALVRRDGAFPSKVKALFMPKPLDEMRDPRDKFTSVPEVYAAAGVKLLSADLKGVVPGTSVVSFQSEPEFMSLKPEMEKELTSILVKTDNMGVIVRAGSVGGLEALLRMLEERGVPVREGDIGDISRNDIVNAAVVGDHDPYLAAILAFDSKVLPDAKESAAEIPIFTSKVIYEVIDSYVDWAAKKRSEDERAALSNITPPCKLRAIPGDFFRNKDPAVFGVEILAGKLRPKVKLMDRDGRELGTVEQIQDKGKAIPEAKLGDKVAISVRGPTLGRSIKENDVLFSQPRSHEVKLLRSKFLAALSEDELQALEEIVRVKSTTDPLYGF